MAALTCEICGGKLIGKPGGVFECDSCGMEYSTEWARAKVQEIKGTVRIEGPVEVQGSVKVEGGASVESLLKRGNIFLEDGDWAKADELFQQVLSIEPENAEGYLGAAMADLHLPDWDSFARRYALAPDTLGSHRSVVRARQFAAGELAARFQALEADRERLAGAYKKELAEERDKMVRMKMIAVGGEFNVAAVKSDGTVLATDSRIQELVKDWRGVVSVSMGFWHTAGLRADGSVVVGHMHGKDVDPNGFRALELLDDVVQVACGTNHVVVLRRDGTVMAAGENNVGQCNVGDWKDIIAISADCSVYFPEYACTLGLRADGTVVFTGGPDAVGDGVRGWKDITAISAGAEHAVGLRADGTVVAAPNQNDGRCQVGSWRNIVAVSAGFYNTVGLCVDGTLLVAKANFQDISHKESAVKTWRDILAVDTGYLYTLGLRRDGRLIAAGENVNGVDQWKLFNNWNTLDRERSEMMAAYCQSQEAQAAKLHREKARKAVMEEQARRRERRAALQGQRQSIQAELANLRGLFSGGRRRELEAKLSQIEKELNDL